MISIWHWIISHWAMWTASGVTGFVGGLLGGAVRWFLPSRKEWAENRESREKSKTDRKVLQEIRRLCDGNSSIYRAREIANRLGMDIDDAADSLHRLQTAGRVQRYEIGSTSDPSPGWRSSFR